MTVSEINKIANEFLVFDDPDIDRYMDDNLDGMKVFPKHAYGLIGLCKLCYAKGMIDMQRYYQNQTANDNLSAKDCQCSDKGDAK